MDTAPKFVMQYILSLAIIINTSNLHVVCVDNDRSNNVVV